MSGPVWCYYCRCYAVNGKCPKCGRFYEINKSSSTSKKTETKSKNYSRISTPSTYDSTSAYASYKNPDGSFAAGFWLAMAINFIAIIIAIKRDKPITKEGAVVGTIISSIIILHVITIIVATINNSSPNL